MIHAALDKSHGEVIAWVEEIRIQSMPIELSSVTGQKWRTGAKLMFEVETWFDDPVDVTDPQDAAAPMVRPVLPRVF